MKVLFALLAFSLLFFSGCSEQKTQNETGKKDHVLRQQIDTMNDARAVSQNLNSITDAQDEQAAQITGH